jgi:prevent-host-death family protein
MNVSISDAKAQIGDLIRRAEEGEQIVLTRDGRAVVQLGPVGPTLTPDERGRIIDEIVREARGKAVPGPNAAHSQDDLYDEYGLPR